MFYRFLLQAYINAINSGVENIQEVLLSPEAQQQLITTGPKLVYHSTKARKTIDTEDTDLKYSAQPDGTLVTEKHQTTEHEEIHDDELPEEDDHSTGSRERIEHKVSFPHETYTYAFMDFHWWTRGISINSHSSRYYQII